MQPQVVFVIEVEAAGKKVMAVGFLHDRGPKGDRMGNAVYFFEEPVLVDDPAVAVTVFACIGDECGGEGARPGGILGGMDDLPVRSIMVQPTVPINEPIAFCSAADAEEPGFGKRAFS